MKGIARRGLTLCVVGVMAWGFLGCSSESGGQGSATALRYAEHVDVDLRLGPSGHVIDFTREDFFFTVTNNGQKAITDLTVEIAFSDGGGAELGKTRWVLVAVDEGMERIADVDKKAKHRPLLPGHTIKLGTDVLYLFAGESGLRDKVVGNWDDLNADISIIKIVTEDNEGA